MLVLQNMDELMDIDLDPPEMAGNGNVQAWLAAKTRFPFPAISGGSKSISINSSIFWRTTNLSPNRSWESFKCE
jgi:hypothetical protein